MKNTLFFTHDFYARQDPKLQSVLAEHGAEGLGIYWCIIEQLYEQGGFLPMQVCKSIAFALHVECKVVESIVSNFGLFVVEGENFTSSSIKKRLEKSNSISESRRSAAKSRWKSVDTQVDMQMQCKCNANAMQNDAIDIDNDNDNIKKKLSKDNSQKISNTENCPKNEEEEMTMFAPEEIEVRDIPQEFVDRWNNAVKLHKGILSKVALLSDARREKILTRYEEFKECGNPIEVFDTIIEKCFASAFLTLQWKVQFDWLFQNNKNWVKVFEGNYDNNNSTNNTTQDNGNNSDDRYAARRRTETKATSWQDYSEVF